MAAEDDIARLVAVMEADLSGFTKGMEQAQKIADQKFGEIEARMNQSEASFLKGFGSIGSAASALGLALSAPALISWTANVVKSTGELENQAKTLGISTDALQAYHAAAVQSGAGAEVGDTAIRRFSVSLGQAEQGIKLQADAFRELGISTADLAAGPEANLPRVAQALLDVTDTGEKARLEMVLFGRSGQDVNQVLQQWANPELIGHMRDMGLVIDKELVQRAAEADKAWELFWLHFKVNSAGLLLGKNPVSLPDVLNPVTSIAADLQVYRQLVDPFGTTHSFAPSAGDLAGIAANAGAQHTAALRAGIPFDPSKLAQPIDVTGSQFGSGKATNALDQFVARMQSAAELAKDTADQRKIDTALIEAANAKLRDQGIAELVVVSSVQQARDILGDQTAQQIEQIGHQTELNKLYGDGATRLEQIRNTAENVTWDDKFIAGLDKLAGTTPAGLLRGVAAVSRAQIAPDVAAFATADLVDKVKEQAAAAALLPQYRAAELAIVRLEYEKQVQLTDEQKQQIVNAYELAQRTKDIVGAEQEMQSTFEGWMLEVEQTGQLNFRKLFTGILQDWEKLLNKMVAQQSFQAPFGNGTGGLIGGLFGDLFGGAAIPDSVTITPSQFADGGVMTSRGRLPLNRYAGGGIAGGPQVALFGEGSQNEAYVPLPDGRSIPVSLHMPQLAPAAQAIAVTVRNEYSFAGAVDENSIRRMIAQGDAKTATGVVTYIQRQMPNYMVKAQRDSL